MNSNRFLALVAICGATIVGVLGFHAYDNAQGYRRIAEMVARGANPQSAACAVWGNSIDGTTMIDPVCVAAQGHQNQ